MRSGIRVWIASGFGVGFIPFAPGTFGSVWGLALAWGLFIGGGHAAVAFGLVTVTAVGLWSASGAERRFGRPDPPAVVVDEVAGQMLSLVFLVPTASTLVAGFVLFRLFDITKPYPARRLEALPGSSGIMADDLLAGVYANLAQQLLHWGFPAWWGAT